MHGTVSPLTNRFLSETESLTLGLGRRRNRRLFLAIAELLVKTFMSKVFPRDAVVEAVRVEAINILSYKKNLNVYCLGLYARSRESGITELQNQQESTLVVKRAFAQINFGLIT